TDVYKIAAAFEILQTSLLIHDDIIDKSDTRRGKPTVYKALGGNHYAISEAMCLGDMGYFLANKLIAQTTFSDAIKAVILQRFSQIVLDTILGQMLDVYFSQPSIAKQQSSVATIHSLKTAQYTIVGPMTIGVLLGRGKKKLFGNIKQFGEPLGL